MKLRQAACAILALCLGAASAAAQNAADDFDRLHKLMAPAAAESQWMQVAWMPSSNIYAARQRAAQEGKPLLLWYMAGEPLGTC
jgi:hypothetical protein